MDANAPTAPRKAKARERERQALNYRLGGLTFEIIGEKLGVTRQSAYQAVKRALENTANETAASADELRKVELRRLDTAQSAIWGDVLKGDVQAVAALMRIMDRRAKYQGLDAPTKQEVMAKIEKVEAYDYGDAIAAIAGRPGADSTPRGEGESADYGPALGQDADGG